MPKIAVVTPYHSEPLEYLEQCHRSVAAQRPEAVHFMVADGLPRAEVAAWPVRHVVLPGAHADCGCVARGVGAALADAEGFDYITFLDADNWYHPGHLQSLVELQQRMDVPVCSSFRTFHQPDGTPMAITMPEEDRLSHVDTSCFFLHRAAFEVNSAWSRIPKKIGLICDSVFLAALRSRHFAIASTRQRTVAYRTLHAYHHQLAGLPPPPGAKPVGMNQSSIDWMLTKEGVDECFRSLGFWPLTFLGGK